MMVATLSNYFKEKTIYGMSNIDQPCVQHGTDTRIRQRDNPVLSGSEKYISRLAKRGLATCSYKLAGLMPQIKKPGINSHATE